MRIHAVASSQEEEYFKVKEHFFNGESTSLKAQYVILLSAACSHNRMIYSLCALCVCKKTLCAVLLLVLVSSF